MASTYTDLLRLEKQADGENENTWGQILNAQLELLEDAIAGGVSLTLAASDVTLSTNNGATDQSRAMFIDCGGTITANINIIVPTSTKFYIVNNGATQTVAETVTVKTSGGSGVVIPNGECRIVVCDGTDVIEVTATAGGTIDADTLDGVDGANYARIDASNEFQKGNAVAPETGTGTTLTPDLEESNVWNWGPLTGATTIANPTNTTGRDGQSFLIKIKNNASTPYSISWGTKYRFSGTAPSGTASVSAVDIYSCYYDETDDLVYVNYVLDVTTAA